MSSGDGQVRAIFAGAAQHRPRGPFVVEPGGSGARAHCAQHARCAHRAHAAHYHGS